VMKVYLTAALMAMTMVDLKVAMKVELMEK
jgi:hypothetical protein